jgi:hypothetical protein
MAVTAYVGMSLVVRCSLACEGEHRVPEFLANGWLVHGNVVIAPHSGCRMAFRETSRSRQTGYDRFA